MKKKACKKCRSFVKTNVCPICKGTDLTETWHGRINVIDAAKSEIAKKINIEIKGEYSIKVR